MGALVVFYITLIAILIFLQWKVSLLRSGKIEIETVHHAKKHKIKVLKQIALFFGHKIKNYLQKVFMGFAVWRIKTWAKVKRFIELRLPGLYTFFAKRPEFEDKHFRNFFWRSVVEYKYKMQRLKAKIREEEIQKSSSGEDVVNDEQLAEPVVTTPIEQTEQSTTEQTIVENTEVVVKPKRRTLRVKKVPVDENTTEEQVKPKTRRRRI